MMDIEDIEIFIDDLLYRLKERGVIAEKAVCFNSKGELVSFEIKITGYSD